MSRASKRKQEVNLFSFRLCRGVHRYEVPDTKEILQLVQKGKGDKKTMFYRDGAKSDGPETVFNKEFYGKELTLEEIREWVSDEFSALDKASLKTDFVLLLVDEDNNTRVNTRSAEANSVLMMHRTQEITGALKVEEGDEFLFCVIPKMEAKAHLTSKGGSEGTSQSILTHVLEKMKSECEYNGSCNRPYPNYFGRIGFKTLNDATMAPRDKLQAAIAILEAASVFEIVFDSPSVRYADTVRKKILSNIAQMKFSTSDPRMIGLQFSLRFRRLRWNARSWTARLSHLWQTTKANS